MYLYQYAWRFKKQKDKTNTCFAINYSGDSSHQQKNSDTTTYACITIIPAGSANLTIAITSGDAEHQLNESIVVNGTLGWTADTAPTADKLKFILQKDPTTSTNAECNITSTLTSPQNIANFNCTYKPVSGDAQNYTKFFIRYTGDNIYAYTSQELKSLKINQIVPTINASINPNTVKLNDIITIQGSVSSLITGFPLSPSQDDAIYFYLNENQITTCRTYTFNPDGTFSCTYQITKDDLPETGTKPLNFSVKFIGNKNYKTSDKISAGAATGCPTQTPQVLSNENVKINPDGSITLINDINPQTSGFSLQIANICPTTVCNDIKIQVKNNSGFIKKDALFLPGDKQPQYTCTKQNATDGTTTITLLSATPPAGFRPWIDNFYIIIHGYNTPFNVSVTTPVDPSTIQLLTRATPMFLNPSFPGCGWKGTVLQRVYDCSKKVKNYSVYIDPKLNTYESSVNPDGTSNYYTLFNPSANPPPNPDDYWFLAACPSGAGGNIPQEQCHWLTPVIQDNNPAFDTTPGGVPTFQPQMLTGYQKRILFGGQLSSQFTWQEANGVEFDSSIQNYANDTSNPGTTPTNGSKQPTNHPVCVAIPGDTLFGGKNFSPYDASIRDIIASASGAAVNWQIPSYPMLILLSGGTPTAQTFVTNWIGYTVTHPIQQKCVTNQNNRPECNNSKDTNSLQGFGAINVPGFIDSFFADIKQIPPKDFFLLSSSGSADYPGLNNIWVYSVFSLDHSMSPYGEPLYGGSMNDIDMRTSKTFFGSLYQIRCVSLSWY